jgi:putative ABC transport system permease protein
MLQDIKAAWRNLAKSAWFTLITVLTLALGIGANTAIFGVVNRLLLNPLPYANSGNLVRLQVGSSQLAFYYATPTVVARAWRDEVRSLDGMEAYELHDVLAYDQRGARVLHASRITPNLPSFLGVPPLLGRVFAADDGAPGAPGVVLLSYESWRRDYGSAADVLGRAITLDGVAHVVVGVMPPRWDAFSADDRSDLWLPLSLDAATSATGDFRAIEVLARLRPEIPVATVIGELDAILASAHEASPRLFGPGFAARVVRPSDLVAPNTRDALLVLVGAVGLVLLVACSNVANLLLARGAARARNLALRAALGATMWRLVRAQLVECLALALAAGVVGVLIGWLTLGVLTRLRPDSLRALDDVRLDPTVLAFTFGVSIVTALLFGVAPISQMASARFSAALRQGALGIVRGGVAPGLRRLLVAAQMALSVILLVIAGLLVRSVIHLQHVDVGFDTTNLFSVHLSLPRDRYQEPGSRDLLSEQLVERIRSLPAVAGATQSFVAPQNWVAGGGELKIRGKVLSDADARAAYPFNFVRPDYFSLLGIRLLAGRGFTSEDLQKGEGVVINRAAARKFWPEGNAVGAEIDRGRWVTVLGVVDDIAAGGLLRARDAPFFYWPFQAKALPTFIGATPGLVLLVRSVGDPAGAIPSVRAAVQALDPEIAIVNVLTTDRALARSIDGPRFNMALLSVFAVLALVLSAVGLAAVIGYEVTERTHEFGIRIALGARTENVRRLAITYGMTPAFIGVVAGVIGALGAAQFATSMLYGVVPRDPLTFVTVVALLSVVAFGASLVPAWRATRIDPIAALRAD